MSTTTATRSREPLPQSTRVVIVGGGFAGAATAAALARLGLGPGLLVEREPLPGAHASGRNAALATQVEDDAIVSELVIAGRRRLGELAGADGPLLEVTGAVHLGGAAQAEYLEAQAKLLQDRGLPVSLWSAAVARSRFAFLGGLDFETALFSASDAVIDIHALLVHYLDEARRGGIALVTECEVREVITSAGRVGGVATDRGEVGAEVVVDAAGAWAGRLGGFRRALPLRAYRRHLFVSGPGHDVPDHAPWVWDLAEPYYFRREGSGLLLSPCDATEHPPASPSTDPEAQALLADKLSRRAPGLGNLEVRRSWACLRTFAPDRRPFIGPDPLCSGLYHVSGLGGFGASSSPAVGEIAAAIIAGRHVPYVDPATVAPARYAD